MQTEPKLHLRKSPAEIVDEMMQRRFRAPNGAWEQIWARQRFAMNAPLHLKKVCAWVEAMIKRERCAETFKSWGTGEQIAANHHRNIAKMKEMAERYGMTPEIFSKVIKNLSSSTEQSRVGPSGFFPCPPEPQNQLSLDVLE